MALFSANGAATSQPSPQGWVQAAPKDKGLKARSKIPTSAQVCIEGYGLQPVR